MKNFDPKKNLEKGYEEKLSSSYNYWIVVALTQGQQDVVFQFLKGVPNTTNKGLDQRYVCIYCKNIFFL